MAGRKLEARLGRGCTDDSRSISALDRFESRPKAGARLLTPRVGLTVLLTSIVLNRCAVRVKGTNLRLEVAAAALVVLGMWMSRVSHVRRFGEPTPSASSSLARRAGSGLRTAVAEARAEHWLLAAWLAANVFSSLTASPNPATSLKLTFLLACLATIALLTRRLIRSPEDLHFALRLWLLLGCLVALYGLAAVGSYHLFGTSFGLHLLKSHPAKGLVTAGLRVRSTLREPNILGSYSLTVALVAAGMLLSSTGAMSRSKALGNAALGLSLCALMMSSTRAALAACVLSASWFAAMVLLAKRPLPRAADLGRLLFYGLAGAALGTAVVSTLPRVALHGIPFHQFSDEWALRELRGGGGNSEFGARMNELKDPRNVDDLRTRFVVWRWALDHWRSRPLLGWGTGSSREANAATFRRTVPERGDEGWIGNLGVHLLHDSGLLGCLGFFAAIGVFVWRALLAARVRMGTEDWAILPCLLAGVIALGVAFQLTEGTWLGFPWAFLGLLAAAADLAAQSGPPGGRDEARLSSQGGLR